MKIGVSEMKPEDVRFAVDIESKSFPNPWSEEELRNTLRLDSTHAIVAYTRPRTLTHPVIGFMVYKKRRRRFDVVNLAVHPAFRRKRVGTAMIEALAIQLDPKGARMAQAVCAETNLAAQLFLKANRFMCVEIDELAYPDENVGYVFVRGFYDAGPGVLQQKGNDSGRSKRQ